jgi:hypothetical protein
MFISTACDKGTNAAPKAPWIIRKTTISPSDVAIPHSIEPTVKPAIETMKRRLRPNRRVR